jgi:hydroxyethylthiazole kinase-like uncharacterized protein yjeF
MPSSATSLSALAPIPIINRQWLSQLLPTRVPTAHKGDFGHILVVGGDYGYGGAAIMAAQAAAHSGAGLISLYTRPEHVSAMLCRQPEVMAHHQHLNQLVSRATVLLLGPGIGSSSWSLALLSQLLGSALPMLIDADGLNYLASLSPETQQQLRRDNWVLTPHPGEAARLLATSTKRIQQDRLAAVQQLQHRFGGTILLKGRGSVICGPKQQLAQLDCGNPGMASGGMGDVLSGVIAALLAQGLSGFEAASVGAWLHSTAADHQAAIQGQRGLLATAILPQLSKLLNGKSH